MNEKTRNHLRWTVIGICVLARNAWHRLRTVLTHPYVITAFCVMGLHLLLYALR